MDSKKVSKHGDLNKPPEQNVKPAEKSKHQSLDIEAMKQGSPKELPQTTENIMKEFFTKHGEGIFKGSLSADGVSIKEGLQKENEVPQDNVEKKIDSLLKYIQGEGAKDIVKKSYNRAMRYMEEAFNIDQKTNDQIEDHIEKRYDIEHDDEYKTLYGLEFKVKNAKTGSYQFFIGMEKSGGPFSLHGKYAYRNRSNEEIMNLNSSICYDSDIKYDNTEPAHFVDFKRYIVDSLSLEPKQLTMYESMSITNPNTIEVAWHLQEAVKSGQLNSELIQYEPQTKKLTLRNVALMALLGTDVHKSNILFAKRYNLEITHAEIIDAHPDQTSEQRLFFKPHSAV